MNTNDASVFSRRLREMRALAGLSQEKLGIEAGLDSSVASARVNRYERGRHQPPEEMMARLAHVLKISTAYFFAEDDRLAEVIRLFAKLSARKQKAMLKTLEKASSS